MMHNHMLKGYYSDAEEICIIKVQKEKAQTEQKERKMDYITLNNGIEMPLAGIGTFLMKPHEAEAAVLSALGNGYRLVDTANAYFNERAVGRAMKKSGLAREEIFLSTKLWPSMYEEGDRAIEETLTRLDTDYIDLLFLHQPAGNYAAAYQAMERAVKAGKVRAIGLSNFEPAQIDEIMAVCETKPAVLQVECHPYYPQTELKAYLKDMGTVIMAWYPLGHGDRTLQQQPVFTKLAEKYGKSSAQIILRWHTQSGNVIIPGSKNEAHIRDNIDIFDLRLTEEEMTEIAAVANGIRYYEPSQEKLDGYLAFSGDFNEQE